MQYSFRHNPQLSKRSALRGSVRSVFCVTTVKGCAQRGVPDGVGSLGKVRLLREEVC